MIKNKNKNKTKNNNIQQRKKQLSRESNLDHLHGRSAPRPLGHNAKADNVAGLKVGKLLYLKYYFREILPVDAV